MFNPLAGLDSIINIDKIIAGVLPKIFAARVKFCILDNKTRPDLFKKSGEWSSIGAIYFDSIITPNSNPNFSKNNFAFPLFPNNKTFPLENEIVYIISLPNNNLQKNVNDISYYYFQPINIWNSNHHNAIPDPIFGKSLPESQRRDYQQTEAGTVRRVTDKGTEIDLGNTFKEKLNIKSIQPFEGDVIYEGRWGQSFRFGSTVNNSAILNPWSTTGENGSPILILRTGQYADGKDPWIPQVEDINKDISAIYATSTQKIPIQVSSKRDYNSYQKAPESPEQFAGEQIILNSGRLLFNTKTDSILFSSNKTINLNSVESVNIDSPTFVVSSTNIFLGDKDATEPVILGNTFLNDFQQLLTQLISLSNVLATNSFGESGTGKPIFQLIEPAQNVLTNAQNMLNRINNYKSKVSKTK
jgi:hypothetical protein